MIPFRQLVPCVCLLVLALTYLVQSYYIPPQRYGKHAAPYYPMNYPVIKSFNEFSGKFICKADNSHSAPTSIWAFQVCDGIKHCKDGSDEDMCTFSCPHGQYKCSGEEKCISLDLFCNNQDDCINRDDEKQCPFSCPHGQYKCSGEEKCISLDLFCNNQDDCINRDDEKQCPFVCPDGRYKCKNEQRCIWTHQVCDRIIDCPLTGEDEKHCRFDRYPCAGGEVTIPYDRMCDGTPHCPQQDDELNCDGTGIRLRGAHCPNGWLAFDRHCYFVAYDGRTFDNAREYCKDLGARMVEIDSEGEYRFVVSVVEQYGDNLWWIGMTESEMAGIWRLLSTNEVPGFLLFAETEPNEPNDEECGVLYGGGTPAYGMGDAGCNAFTIPTLCELVNV